MNRTSCALVTLVLTWNLATLAQQPTGGPDPTPAPRGGPDLPNLEALTVEVEAEVLQVDTERNAIQIQPKRNAKPMGLRLDSKCKIKADKKQFGKKDLSLAEVEAGYQVELTVRRADMQVIEMKVKKPKEKSSQETTAAPKN